MACVCAVTYNEATYSMPGALEQTVTTITGYLNTTKQVCAMHAIAVVHLFTYVLTTVW